MRQYVALLRGINVGGKNPIRMTDLRACLEGLGLGDVVTYIQSGNVLFATERSDRPELAREIEDAIAARFGCRSSVVLRTPTELRDVVDRAPGGFGADPARYRYDVLFLREPLTAATAIREVPVNEGVDEAHAGPGVLYFSRLVREASRSHLARIVSLPIYKSMTIRNWNTTTRLLRMLEEGAVAGPRLSPPRAPRAASPRATAPRRRRSSPRTTR